MSARQRFLKEFPKAVSDDAASIFIGAGVSIGAGYPSWKELLREIGDELGVKSDDVHDLAALAQWSVSKSAGRTRIHKVLRDAIAPEHPIPDTVKTIARLPVRNLWTTNYDRLIERAFSEIGRPIDPVSAVVDLSTRPRPGAARLFKMHGSIDRLNDIVIATDDYELYRLQRGAFLPLLQAHMTSFSMLFMGLSFSDPNVRHVLSLIRESFASSPPEHFAIVRPPQENEFRTVEEFKARHTQHKLWSADLLRYGLNVVEIDAFDDVSALLRDVERRVASSRVWVSGSWPLARGPRKAINFVTDTSTEIGNMLGREGYSLVSGGGLTVGPASVSGFLAALQRTGTWDLERRLLVRPFPQPLHGQEPDRVQWQALRAEMARISGSVIFIGGAKLVGPKVQLADGVRSEMEAAAANGSFLIPVGATGGMAKQIAKEMLSADSGSRHENQSQPSKNEIGALLSATDPGEIARIVKDILKRRWQ